MTEKKAEYTCPEDEKPQYGTNWMDIILDEQQQNEVRFNRTYADRFNHGTDGHNPRILIAILAEAIDLLASNAICCDVLEILTDHSNCEKQPNKDCPECKGSGDTLPFPIGNLHHDLSLIPCLLCME